MGEVENDNLTYSDARTHLADLLDKAVAQPVTITRRTAPDVVVISAALFADLQQTKFNAALGRVEAANSETLKALASK